MTATERACAVASAVSAGVVLLLVSAVGVLSLDNAYGPLAEHPRLGGLAGLGAGVLAGALVLALGWWAGRRSPLLLLALVVAVCASGWVLTPRRVDTSESFVPRPNARWSCTGWSFRHYPPETSDAATTTYCVGLERRIADG
jgi:hypothetical protein